MSVRANPTKGLRGECLYVFRRLNNNQGVVVEQHSYGKGVGRLKRAVWYHPTGKGNKRRLLNRTLGVLQYRGLIKPVDITADRTTYCLNPAHYVINKRCG